MRKREIMSELRGIENVTSRDKLNQYVKEDTDSTVTKEFEFEDVAIHTDDDAKEQIETLENANERINDVGLKSELQIFTIIRITFIIILFIVICAVLITISRQKENYNETSTLWENFRLPSFIVPIHYDLYINPNFTSLNITGNVNISFIVIEKTSFIVLNVVKLSTIVSIFKENNEKMVINEEKYNKAREQLHIKVNESLKLYRNYILQISFEGKLRYSHDGIYLSSYKTADGKTRRLVSTLFEHSNARKAFPCFDDPAMKATFQLTILHKNNHSAYFNTKVKTTAKYDLDSNITVFEKTVKMSTYLVAFVVCDYSYIEDEVDGINVKALAPLKQIHQCNFALNTTIDVLPFFNTLFSIKYALPKLDMIVIPNFLPAGMENWGLITYSPNAFYYDAFAYDNSRHQYVATVIAHEIAHQWFGNLVTMDWWSDIWLNEGFATYFQYVGVNRSQPDWNMMDQFIVLALQPALSDDCYETTRYVSEKMAEVGDIRTVFNSIIYKKGACILRMLENFISTEIFYEGIRNYLTKYQYANAKTEDLFHSLMEVERNLNISKVMNTWVYQKGFPLIYANYKNRSVKLTQKRFMLVESDENTVKLKDSHSYIYKWFIPVTYITNSEKNQHIYWLHMTHGEILFEEEISWLKLNVKSVGFYRVMYNEDLWKIFIEELQKDHKVLSQADRSNLLDDAFTLSKTKILNIHLALNLSRYLVKERDFVPWDTALTHLKYMYQIIKQNVSARKYFKKFVQKLTDPVIESLGWKDKGSHLSKKLRSRMLSASLTFNFTRTTRNALRLFTKWKTHGKVVPRNLRSFVYNTGVKYGGKSNWEYCEEKRYRTQIQSETSSLLHALAYTQDHNQLHIYLNRILPSIDFYTEDKAIIISALAENSIFNQKMWMFLKTSFPKFMKMYEDSHFMSSCIIASLSNLKTQLQYDNVKSYIPQITSASLKQEFLRILEKIQCNIFWKNNVEISVIQWLQKNDL